MVENQYISLLNAMADLLEPWLEVSIFAADDKSWRYTYHALSIHQQDNKCPQIIPQGKVIEELTNGKKTKTHYLTHHDQELGDIIIRLRYDMTWFAAGFEELKRFMGQSSAKTTMPPWEIAINQAIEQFLNEKSLNLGMLNRLEKRELMLSLYEKGLLNYKDATLWLANRLNLSRATVYNHLNWAKSVRKIRVHQVDAFSEAPFGGNPAGVVLDAESLDEDIMKSITKEMNNAETSFILPSVKDDFRIRYFTPTGQEMVFCGHSTVGALYMLAKEKRMKMQRPGTYQFKVETLSGSLRMGCHISNEGEIEVNFYSPKIILEQSNIKHDELATMLGLSLRSINTNHTLYYEKTNKDLYITVKDLKALQAIECDTKTMVKFCKQHDITVICALTPYAFSENNQIHMRCFAPSVGINEDIFTGSVIGGLIAYAEKNKIIPNQQGEIGLEQGHFLNRPGMVKVKYAIDKGNFEVQVIAKANHFFSTEIQLT